MVLFPSRSWTRRKPWGWKGRQSARRACNGEAGEDNPQVGFEVVLKRVEYTLGEDEWGPAQEKMGYIWIDALIINEYYDCYAYFYPLLPIFC